MIEKLRVAALWVSAFALCVIAWQSLAITDELDEIEWQLFAIQQTVPSGG